jgi:Tfp pilus assembly protein PilN
MAAQGKKKEINLLPKEKWEVGTVGKLLRWALNVGRYVVVFTELIVISAFLFRFGLDAKLTDLNEELKQKQTVINSYGDLEDKFRRVQRQLQNTKEVEEKSLQIDQILNNISQITPMDTVYSSINIKDGEVSLEGQTFSEVGLATLLAKAQTSELFSGVMLDSVSSATEKSQAIDFRMILSLEKQE